MVQGGGTDEEQTHVVARETVIGGRSGGQVVFHHLDPVFILAAGAVRAPRVIPNSLRKRFNAFPDRTIDGSAFSITISDGKWRVFPQDKLYAITRGLVFHT